MFKLSWVKTCGAAAAMSIAPMLATASPIDFDAAPGGLFGTPALYTDVSITFDGDTFGARAGGFNVVSSDNESFVAWCIDLAQYLRLSKVYEETTGLLTAVEETNISKLFTGFFDGIDTGLESAAFQIAIWELISDTDHNLDEGTFVLNTDGAVALEAENYLQSLSQFGADYELRTFYSRKSQDLVTGVPAVPLPATGLLLLAGVASLAIRRKTRA